MNEAYLFEKTRGLIKYLGQMRVLGLIFGKLVQLRAKQTTPLLNKHY